MAETSLSLTFQDNSNRESAFLVERKEGAGAFSQVAELAAAHDPEPTVVAYTDTGLTEATQYTYRVRARNAGGDSAYSNEATATTLPAAPTSLSALDISATEIDLTWTNHSAGATGYKIERKQGAGAFSQITTVGAMANSYSDTGLTSGVTYTYRVRAYDTGGNSAYTNESSATTTSAGIPTANMLFDFWADNIPPQTDNTSIAAWQDGAPVPHALQSPGTNGGTQPKYRTAASGAAINGHPVVEVSSGNQMDIPYPNFSPRRNDTSFTAYWVGRYTSPQAGAGVLLYTYRTSPADGVIRLSLDGIVGANVAYEYDVGAGPVDNNVAAAVSGVQLLTFVFDKGSDTAKVYRNGTQIGVTGTIGGASPNKGFDWGDDFIEFFAVAGGSSAIVGDHGRFIGYEVAHDVTTQQGIETILKTYYGIP